MNEQPAVPESHLSVYKGNTLTVVSAKSSHQAGNIYRRQTAAEMNIVESVCTVTVGIEKCFSFNSSCKTVFVCDPLPKAQLINQ